MTARDEQILGKPPRLAPADLPPETAAEVLGPVPARYGDRPRPLMVMTILHNEAVARRFRPVPTEERSLAPRDQELAILRTAWLCQIPFVWGEHVPTGKAAGLTCAEIERITRGSAADGWSAHDQAVLRAAEELRADAMISDATWETLARTLSPAQLVELPALIGQYQCLGYLQNSLRIPLWPGNDGLESR
jgi:alkylhydroperoxidase family enzyme